MFPPPSGPRISPITAREGVGQMAAKRVESWTGVIDFAGVMLVVLGAFNFIEGLVVLLQEDRITVTPARFVVLDTTTWGWSLLIFGALMVTVGAGLLTHRGWARIVAMIVVGLHALGQVLSLGALPVWSLLMLALDTAILFALTAGWSTPPSVDPYAPHEEMHPTASRQVPTLQSRQ
jgi:hypothetical protein